MVKKSGRLERGIFESERNFRLLAGGVVDYAICMLDLDGHVINWNKGAQRITGHKTRGILGKHFSLFYLPEDRASGAPEKDLQSARKTKHFATEGWRVRKDGSKFYVSAVIDPIYENRRHVGYAMVIRDTTERRRAAADLEASENQFRLLVSNVTDYALYMLTPAGIVANWNAGGQRIKGYAPEEIIGQSFARFYTPADQASGKPARALRIAEETGHYVEEGWRVRKDGSFFWASVVIHPIREADGTLVGFAKITRDISERLEAQQKLEQVQRQLAESQKMDALGQLTGGVAHDFNNLLMIILGNLHRIKREVTSERGRLALGAIETASQRAASLTNQLLTFARRQSLNPQTIDVAERIASVREVLSSALGSKIQLSVEIEADVWPIFVDPGELETALINLVVNARDAMPEGGMLTVSARNVPDADQVVVSVKDCGQGIPSDVLGRVFDPFFTTKPVGKGTGLGLSQVHGFAHQTGGKVEIASALGEGTTVSIYLPRGTIVDHPEIEDRPVHKPATILLVEDNPAVADASTGLLEQLGYTVRWASSAESALQELESNGIDVVFSDIVMPGKMDGLKLARTIRDKKPELPILLTTGYSNSARQVKSDFPVLRKPFHIHELSRELSKLTGSPSETADDATAGQEDAPRAKAKAGC
ncbi:PAS domain S-box protein [Bradyrhizobium sp. WSM 1704]|uniref:hybrid sensor histidine kinase/response regulator n=1 Tax=Bradyrhizobium semiaridum TaxID=2821404 RepID=UPI001CE3A7C1|nr:PAS domain-containing sensor histidine kinase [Bradyrhizobium semiaridum]MCA6120360.1 PAS domain S-box protein [Bradyrhizobium semiaridum]